MNIKQLRFYQLFADFSRVDINDTKYLDKYIAAFLELDFTFAVNIWEYLILINEQVIAADANAATHFCDRVFDLFLNFSSQRTLKLIYDSAVIKRAVFMYSPLAHTGAAFDILNNLLFTNKTDEAEEILKCLLKNTFMELSFGALLKEHLEKLFTLILKKSVNKKIEMSRKLTALLLTYIAKVKTGERALLEQRIKETL